MKETIKTKLDEIPESPGIYKMLDQYGAIIYIGKSKCLKKRVKSYFVDSPKWEKVKKMVPFICDFEYTATDTHLEALVLECELIKSIKPRFNVLMKNDHRYIYLSVEKSGKKPLTIVYEKGKSTFGPFRSRSTIENMIESMKSIYPIKKANRRYQFEYHIFPISMDETTFAENRKVLVEILKHAKYMLRLIKELNYKMKMSASESKFETASKYRDLINNLMYINKGLTAYENIADKKIVVDIEIEKGHKLFFISHGQILHNEIFPILSDEHKEKFVREGREIYSQSKLNLADKAAIDYRDIIYHELNDISFEILD